ncbi:hypothetical protein AJ87_32625 [Rhizobium yanglingense]|nr:hypothetical protein AJ87_32625 [Rhizobium yanglingense]
MSGSAFDEMPRAAQAGSSNPLDKPIQHPLLPGPIKIDRQLVALDPGNIPIAEFQVEDAVAHLEAGGFGGGGFGNEFAFDGAAPGAAFAVADTFDRVARAGAPIVAGGVGLVGLGAFPAGGGIGIGEGVGLVERDWP